MTAKALLENKIRLAHLIGYKCHQCLRHLQLIPPNFFLISLRTLTAALSPQVMKLTNTAIASLTDVAVAAILPYCPSENSLAHRPLQLWCHCLSICTISNKFYLTRIEQSCNYEHVCPAISLLHEEVNLPTYCFLKLLLFVIFSFILEWHNPL